jgi:hypothetical protein
MTLVFIITLVLLIYVLLLNEKLKKIKGDINTLYSSYYNLDKKIVPYNKQINERIDKNNTEFIRGANIRIKKLEEEIKNLYSARLAQRIYNLEKSRKDFKK